MPCGFSTKGLDGRRPDAFELFKSAGTPAATPVIVSCVNELVSPRVLVSRTRLIAWTNAAHVGAKEKKEEEEEN